MHNQNDMRLKSFWAGFEPTRFNKGETILKPGAKVDFVGQVKKGFVRIYMIDNKGEQVTLPYFNSLLTFTLIKSKLGIKNKFFIESLTNSEIYIIPKDKMMAHIKEHPEIEQMIVESISRSYIEMLEYVGNMLSGSAYEKVEQTISYLMAKNDFPISHKLVASMTGLTRETVTIQLLKMEKEGLIAKDKRKIHLLNKT